VNPSRCVAPLARNGLTSQAGAPENDLAQKRRRALFSPTRDGGRGQGASAVNPMGRARDFVPDRDNLHLFSPSELDSGAEHFDRVLSNDPGADSAARDARVEAERAVDEAIRRPDQRLDVRSIGGFGPRIDALCSDYPFFGLSPDIGERRFQMANGDYVSIIPTARGAASVHDRDVLIFALSALVFARNMDVPVSPRLRFAYTDLLHFTGRKGGGRDYATVAQALDRLRGTTVKVARACASRREVRGEGWLVSYRDVEPLQRGRTLEVLLHPFLYSAVLARSFLSLPREYFELRSPVARRILELACKNTRNGRQFSIRLPRLAEKLGLQSDVRKLRYFIQREMGPLPGMETRIDLVRDQATFTRAAAEAAPSTAPQGVSK